MGNVLAFKKRPESLKTVHCEHCGGYKFAAMQDETTVSMQMWCVECWTIASNIEIKEKSWG